LNTLVFSGIYPFKLPTLAALGATSAAEMQSASIGFAVTSVTGNLIGTPGGDAPNFGIDAFALTSTRTSADVLTGDDSAASPLIAADILTASPLVPSAANTRNVVESASLLSLLQSLYTSDPTLGDDDFLFIRLSPNGGTVGSNMGYNVASANNGVAQPLLTIAIPEPASLSMLAMGGLLLRRRRLD
ncbi:MAG TPA: PEP-CTERM sorting domain-containing protein, partial [Tepidisphaeraceae bacterium]|nr:PEP-CTERM sorting domain-containing protein [Tepidisphaeraceae bacterium]